MGKPGIRLKDDASSRWVRAFARACVRTGCRTQAELAKRCGMDETQLSRMLKEDYQADRSFYALCDRGFGAYPGWTTMLWELAHNTSVSDRAIDLHLMHLERPLVDVLLERNAGESTLWVPLIQDRATLAQPQEELQVYWLPGTPRPECIAWMRIGHAAAATLSTAPPAYGDLVLAEVDNDLVPGRWYMHGRLCVLQGEHMDDHYASDLHAFGRIWIVLTSFTAALFSSLPRRQWSTGGTSVPEDDCPQSLMAQQ